MICSKCDKEFKYESAFNKHIEKCTGRKSPTENKPPELGDPKKQIGIKAEQQYDAMLSLIALLVFKVNKVDAKIIYDNKSQAAKAVGTYAEDHIWIVTALDKVMNALSITGVLIAHMPIIQGIVENHQPEIDKQMASVDGN